MQRPSYEGSNFDDFLAEQGILEECTAVAMKRKLARQLNSAMKKQGVNKTQMAERMKTSRAQVNRMLDADNNALTLDTLSKAAQVLGFRSVNLTR